MVRGRVGVDTRVEREVIVFYGDATGFGAGVEDRGDGEGGVHAGREVGEAGEEGEDAFGATGGGPDEEAEFEGETGEAGEGASLWHVAEVWG